MQLALVLLSTALGVVAFLAFRFYSESRELRLRFRDNLSAENELRTTRAALTRSQLELQALDHELQRRTERLAKELSNLETQHAARCAALEAEYVQAKATYDQLRHDVSLLEENANDMSFGLYKPHFRFDTSDEYKASLLKAREQQKAMLRNGTAAKCSTFWTINNSEREGERMVKQYQKLILLAFNGECDAAVANVAWNNASKMEERIEHACSALNKLGGVVQVTISKEYLAAKLDELRLAFEYEEKKHAEKEEERRIREQIREEERAQKSFEKAQAEAETEEARYQRALEKARSEVAQATGAQLQKLTEQIAGFEAKLDEARKKKERAIARAQLTKSGFIYIISNIGSFGPKVVKIGMTRRLEPMERVIELGSASVPFAFDVHAMLYSDDAPKLEAELHQYLQHKRVNLVSSRKEFYSDVDLSEVESFVRAKGLMAQFISTPEAREYRETMAKRTELAADGKEPEAASFPPTLFASTTVGSDA